MEGANFITGVADTIIDLETVRSPDSTGKNTRSERDQSSISGNIKNPVNDYDSVKKHIEESIDNFLRSTQADLKIRLDSETHKIMIKVIREADGKVIREIPPEELLKVSANIEQLAGLLIAITA